MNEQTIDLAEDLFLDEQMDGFNDNVTRFGDVKRRSLNFFVNVRSTNR